MSNAEPTVETAYRPTKSGLWSLLYALFLAFRPHEHNSPTRKWVTLVLVIGWVGATGLAQLGYEHPDPNIYWALTVVVFSIVSHLWGFEYGVLSAVSGNMDPPDEDTEDDSESG